MTTASPNRNWLIAYQWVVMTTLGWAVAWAISRLWAPAPIATESIAVLAADLLVSACVVAGLQWAVLRRYLPSATGWIIIVGPGLAVAALAAAPIKLLDLYVGNSRLQWDEVLYGAAFGLLLGIAQAWALRRRLNRSAVWVAASIMGWTLAEGMSAWLPLESDSASASLISTLVRAALTATPTGIALAWLLIHPSGGAGPAADGPGQQPVHP
jgi:hypothetical protein